MRENSATEDDNWHVQLVKITTMESLEGFIPIVFAGSEHPVYQFRNGELWKSACSIKVWDDGRVHVVAEKHLTPLQRWIVAGLAQEYFRAGPARCRREKWRRIRRSSGRPVASWASCFWVRAARREDPGYAAAQADMQIVAASLPSAFDGPSHRQSVIETA